MRKESKQLKAIQHNGIQGYHEGGSWEDREQYARVGFEGGFKVYASDRCKAADGTAKTYGLEIELESGINSSAALGVILDKVVFPTFPAGLFKQQHDGSLGGASSTEVITQPMTKAFIRNHYNDFRAMWCFLKDLHTAPGPSCGMHTNISMTCFGKTREAQEAAIMRLHNWICDNYAFAAALFKRDLSHTRYCGRMERDYLDTCGSHGLMCNYSHMSAGTAARVEIRLVGPQKTFPNFRNTLEVIFHLVEAAKDGRDFSDPVKLWAGCNECVVERLGDVIGDTLTYSQYEEIKAKSINAGIKAATR